MPSFPGAEGAGSYAVGGRGGDVYHVTNLNNSGTGSLRYGIDNAPSNGRTIVFDVCGTIPLEKTLRIQKPNITIAGQTAPGAGICITNWDTQIENTHDVVLQHLRFRPGLARAGTGSNQFHGDSLELNAVNNVMVDHCSASWSIDECMACTGDTNITFQWCYMTEALHDTHFHPYGPTQKHSDGVFFSADGADCSITGHHNLMAHDNLRMPRVRSYDFYVNTADLRNNVMYNWGETAAYGGGSTSRTIGGVTKDWYDDRALLNFVGNYAVAGPSTQSDHVNYCLEDWGKGIDPNGVVSTWDMHVYANGNKIDSDRDHVLDGADTGWDMTTVRSQDRMSNAFAMPGVPVTTESADSAYQSVLAQGGAMPLRRDSVDTRIVGEVNAQTGSIINSQADVGGYPGIYVVSRAAGYDTDGDGMPNWWETANGMNPNADDHLGDVNSDGYTNLENYLDFASYDATVPEPTSLSLAALGALALLRKRRGAA